MKVVVHRTAQKYLDRLSATDRTRIRAALKALEKEPPKGDIVPYEGAHDMWRLKVSSFRALFAYEDDRILVTHIEPRGQAYTKKTRNKRG